MESMEKNIDKAKDQAKAQVKKMAQKKARKIGKKIFAKIMIPYGIAVLLALIVIIVLVTSITGFMGDTTSSDKYDKKVNKELASYLKKKVNDGNDLKHDYYKIDETLVLTPGEVQGYIKYMETYSQKDSDDEYFGGVGDNGIDRIEYVMKSLTKKLKTETNFKDNYTPGCLDVNFSNIDTTKIKNKTFYGLAPTFKYDKKEIKTTRKYKDFDTTVYDNISVSYYKPSVPAEKYPIKHKIYSQYENKTYTVEKKEIIESELESDPDAELYPTPKPKPIPDYPYKKTIQKNDFEKKYEYYYEISNGKPSEMQGCELIYNVPYNANNFQTGEKLFNINNVTKYDIVDKTSITKENPIFLTSANTIKTNVQVTYEEKTIQYDIKENNPNRDGNYTIVKPAIKEIKPLNKNYETLKNILKSQYPNETELDMAIHYIINGSSNNYNNKKQDGNWINSFVDSSTSGTIINSIDGEGFTGEIPLFLQTDNKWATYPYGAQGTIASSACGPTSLAMVVTGLEGTLNSWDKNGDGILTPPEAADFSVASNCRDYSNGTTWNLFEKAAKAFGLQCRQYSPLDEQAILAELKQGNPVIASMHAGDFTSVGHFIVLTGVTPDGKIKVNDPNSQERSNKLWDFYNIIIPQSNQFWAFNNPSIQYEDFEATAYGGVMDTMNGSGVTADGTNIKGLDFTARIIAVDPKLIPLGSIVYIKFPDSKRYQTKNGKVYDLNGLYTARDTGGAIKSNHIDLFMGYGGEEDTKRCMNFGTSNIKLRKHK